MKKRSHPVNQMRTFMYQSGKDMDLSTRIKPSHFIADAEIVRPLKGLVAK
jgi:hypothetical protein